MSETKQFQNMAELTAYLGTLEDRISGLEGEKAQLTENIKKIGYENRDLVKRLRFLPETGLLNRSFLSRAFAVWGHYFVAQFIISLGFLVIYLIFLVLIFAATAGSR